MRELIAAAVIAIGPGAAAGETAMAAARQPASAHRPVPPSLSAGALATELREAQRRRLEELAEIQRERARLERLAAEIAIARRELVAESALLEAKAAKVERSRPERDGAGGRKDAPAVPAQPDDARAQTLAKTVKGMKPDQAAALVSHLEKALAVAVLGRLRPADAAAVLGKMPAGTAAELFTLMARNGAPAR